MLTKRYIFYVFFIYYATFIVMLFFKNLYVIQFHNTFHILYTGTMVHLHNVVQLEHIGRTDYQVGAYEYPDQ